MKNKLSQIGLLIILLAALTALLAPWLVPKEPPFFLENRFQAPSWNHLLGCDEAGRDLATLVLQGVRLSLGISVATVSLSALVGTTLGLIAGYFGGRADQIFILLTDMILSFPSLLLIIGLAAFQREGSVLSVIGILSAVGWVSYARLVRGQLLSLKEREFVLAATGIGASFPRLCLRHLLPNLMGPLLVNATIGMAGVILAESTLSFLGLGLPPTIPSWGRLLDQGVSFLLIAPHLSIFPGLAIALLTLSFNLVGDGLRDRFDVRERIRS